MKYGLYYFKNTHNIGDDIWAYAQSLFYPHIDYLIDNTSVYKFKSENDEAVATIIGAFVEPRNYEYTFFPGNNVIPLFVGAYFRSTMWEIINSEMLISYLKAYAPIGVRNGDIDKFKALGINTYFSGCITMTLPKLEKKQNEKPYICCVDVPNYVVDYIRQKTENRFEIKIMTHELPKMGNDVYLKHRELSIEERFAKVQEYIEIYAGAHCVVTNKLHCALPCLTQQTPVLLIFPHDGKNIVDLEDRIMGFASILNMCSYEDFLEDKVCFDFVKPLKNPNKELFLLYRENIQRCVEDFVVQCESGKMVNKYPFTDLQRQEYMVQILEDKVTQLKNVVDSKNYELEKWKRCKKSY